MLTSEWVKATKSNTNGACAYVRRVSQDRIEVRNSSDPAGTIVGFTEAEWDAFLDGAKGGEFDLP